MIDYKINSIRETKDTTTIDVSFFNGEIKKVPAPIILGDYLVDGYVRTTLPIRRTFAVSNGGSSLPLEKIVYYLNEKLLEKATVSKDVIVSWQKDISASKLTER